MNINSFDDIETSTFLIYIDEKKKKKKKRKKKTIRITSKKRKCKGVPSGANTRHIFNPRLKRRDKKWWPERKSKIGTTHDKNHTPGKRKECQQPNPSSILRKREEGKGKREKGTKEEIESIGNSGDVFISLAELIE
ncbi:hypothetical protein BOTNAR_0220g00130 [Botryotinia narcissicola]|uniref:Uncharacterized protein n=1 Tax=Botryotinia narcissicola TaxID=278944 RepID=A0A4Z1I7B1_9HELO|nr:hypothetical protein BOTNAR_0220g00130 [Botryotinia narcissicola]